MNIHFVRGYGLYLPGELGIAITHRRNTINRPPERDGKDDVFFIAHWSSAQFILVAL